MVTNVCVGGWVDVKNYVHSVNDDFIDLGESFNNKYNSEWKSNDTLSILATVSLMMLAAVFIRSSAS